jgi:putative endopeptidase
VNGNWVKTTQIPSDKASWGSFNALRENVDDASLDILNKILSESYPAGSEGQKIQNLYASFMDTVKEMQKD